MAARAAAPETPGTQALPATAAASSAVATLRASRLSSAAKQTNADQASLEAVLEAIATQAISCTFNLDSVPPNPDQIFVFFDGTAVPEDPTMMNGWFYDPVNNQIVFYGDACNDLKSGEVVDIDVILGCDVPD